jgi:glycosyltransferase involved in cell wall biosynthesis
MGMRPYRRSGAQQFAMMWATRVIANSQAGLDAWCIAPGRGRVIYNGFDPARLNLCRAINQFDARAFTIAMTGRMSLEKNFTMLIDAARVLEHSAHAGWRFVLIGDGPDRARHIYAARDLIARGMVLFPEPCLEVIRVLNDANVGVLLSHPTLHAEGISNSIMEYMACGLPVVCSDSGGNRELVLDGETGFIIPPRDVNALVEKLTWLKDHPAQAAQMGQAGRERIRAHFSVEQMVEKTIAVYREVL